MSVPTWLPQSWQAPDAFWRSKRHPTMLNQVLKLFLIVVFAFTFVYEEVVEIIEQVDEPFGTFVLSMIFKTIGCLFVLIFFNYAVCKENIPLLVLVVIFYILVIIGLLFFKEVPTDPTKHTMNILNAVFLGTQAFAYVIWGFDVCQGAPASQNTV